MTTPSGTKRDEIDLTLAAAIVLFATALRLMVLANEAYPLYGDEAQYWAWSRDLDWGYFSKPPLIAWLIRLTTGIFGDHEFGVRVAAPILHGFTAIIIGDIARRLYGKRAGFWAAVLYISLPAVSVSSMLISTDVPLLFFWAAGLWLFQRALETNGRRPWLALGLVIGLGSLAKYAMLVFVPSAVLYLLVHRRDQFRNPRLYVPLAITLLCLLPNLGWNYFNDFPTIGHTVKNAEGGGFSLKPSSLLDFIVSQLGVFGPLPMVLLVLALAPLPKVWRSDKAWLLAAFALPQFLMIAVVALLSRAHGNWAATVYISATVLVVAYAQEVRWRQIVLVVAVAMHVVLAGVGYAFHDLAKFAGIELTAKTDPYRRLAGAREVGQAVQGIINGKPGIVVMTEERMLFALLSFYVRPQPPQVEWNPNQVAHNHFEMTTDLSFYADQPILFVTASPQPDALTYFREVEQVGTITLPLYKDLTKRYYMFQLQGFKGYDKSK